MSNVINIDGTEREPEKVMTMDDYMREHGDHWISACMKDREEEVEAQEMRQQLEMWR